MQCLDCRRERNFARYNRLQKKLTKTHPFMTVPDHDARLDLLRTWIAARIAQVEGIVPASADASFRRYFRVTDAAGATWIVMDAPPELEDSASFVRVAELMQKAGVFAPQVLDYDLKKGFLLLTDLGPQTYLDALNADNAPQLFRDATEALIRWQLSTRPEVLPLFSETVLRQELQLFPDWYVGHHLQKTFTPAQEKVWGEICDLLVASALAQPKVYVHRDFMPRNLMVCAGENPGVIDFQDAAMGPISYDIISLYRDAFMSWEEEFVLDGVVRYWEGAKNAGLPVNPQFGEFYKDCEWMGLHRHLKVMGIFARIRYRDGKPKYLEDAPRFEKYVRAVTQRYSALTPLTRLFNELHNTPPEMGYTF